MIVSYMVMQLCSMYNLIEKETHSYHYNYSSLFYIIRMSENLCLSWWGTGFDFIWTNKKNCLWIVRVWLDRYIRKTEISFAS